LTRPVRDRVDHLGDFSLSRRVLTIAACAVPIGGAGALAALALLRLIGLITNLVFYQRFNTRLVAPDAGHHQPLLILLAPVVGGLIIGLMARFGSEKIRGHGMPEAIEAILTRGSRVDPRVAVLKPISAAISIGSGGPFGAEGPIIMTGGAVGSVVAQTLHMSADERKTLLVAGAAAGMAATFNAPLASVLLAVELLLFEWRPRSLVPVVAGDRRAHHRDRRAHPAARAGRRLRRDRSAPHRPRRHVADHRHPRGQDAHLGAVAGLGHLRGRARPRVHDRWRAGRARGARAAVGDAGVLGAHRTVGGRGRRHALAADRRRVPARAHPRG
jgi:hypothetical protein